MTTESLSKAHAASRRFLRFGLALSVQGLCFLILNWEGSLPLMIGGSVFLLIAFLLRLPQRKEIGFLNVFRAFAMFVLGVRILFVSQHLWFSEQVNMVSLLILVVWALLQVANSEKSRATGTPVFLLRLWIGMALFALFVGSLFKIQHWPGADQMLLVAFQSLSLILILLAKNPDWGMRKESA